mmetsp:Transcript_93256/g.147393  ORF Transcript_93256/g.147393 Transcript_93256/m.147393 type:complete len:88 (+) Transcript_93256:53-316(+)|eukprot:CAMPEP_0169103234 /NCGR_PEP_ID=MMETSP1015-20121227/22601_1 /TAXON_ID=342587 /ORGANISM="Karlodinium micrum, Strain CCMP2283" /LENGTH=87 /DNA_ID=CAMNT_0009164407 /DNA_START=47 /DNA_END=310 /DNA_ORIENTATION=+
MEDFRMLAGAREKRVMLISTGYDSTLGQSTTARIICQPHSAQPHSDCSSGKDGLDKEYVMEDGFENWELELMELPIVDLESWTFADH